MADGSTSQVEIGIVGGGPIGLTLALFLDRLGVRCALFNTAPTTRWHPKGSTQGARTMEHFRRLGIADAIEPLQAVPDRPPTLRPLLRVAAVSSSAG